MSVYYQRIALLCCGICPDCRKRSLTCFRTEDIGHFGTGEYHFYHCENCIEQWKVHDFEVNIAYRKTRHWDSPPNATGESE